MIRKLFKFLAAGTAALMFCLPAFAYTLPALDETCSLTVTITFSDEAISGVPIEIRKVADYTEESGSVSYTLTEEYEAVSDAVIFDGMTAAQSQEAVDILVAVNTDAYAAGVTDENGQVVFDITDYGIYLVSQPEEIDGYETITSFLIAVPYYSETDDDWDYDVEASPKTEARVSDETGDSSGDSVSYVSVKKTGDRNLPYILSVVAGVAVAGAVVCVVMMRRKK